MSNSLTLCSTDRSIYFQNKLSFMIGARTKATYCTMYAIYVHDMGVNYACMRHLYVKFINIVLN